jgi:hypothetical protein
MKKNFGIPHSTITIKEAAGSLWMDFQQGEGELEIKNQGRFVKSRFSQETEAKGQQTPRNGEGRSKLRFTQRVSSAGCTLDSDSTPQFSFFSTPNEVAAFKVARKLQNNLRTLGLNLDSLISEKEKQEKQEKTEEND